MLKHDFFEELCALAATGQLSSEEELQLTDHLTGCASCREAREEFAGVFEELPRAGGARVDQSVLRGVDVSAFRMSFLTRAPTEGRRFSEEAKEAIVGRSWTLPRFLPAYQWMTAGILAGILLGAVGYRTMRAPHQQSGTTAALMPASARVDSPAAGNEGPGGYGSIELQAQDGTSQKTISALKAANAALAVRLTAVERRLATSESEKRDLDEAMARITALNSHLSSEMEQNRDALSQTTAELEKARSDRESMASDLSTQKTEVDVLSQQIRVQNASLGQERQLLAAGRDITDLMGARNLHIMDVYDVDGRGKDRKSFGRIFYTEGRSLIFYAFDLDEKKLVNAKYHFEAWGERLGQPTSVKSLGILYADDKAQRRWVLKVDDPRQIAEFNSVFVTLEPHDRDSTTPRGKRILYASLAGEPNHP